MTLRTGCWDMNTKNADIFRKRCEAYFGNRAEEFLAKLDEGPHSAFFLNERKAKEERNKIHMRKTLFQISKRFLIYSSFFTPENLSEATLRVSILQYLIVFIRLSYSLAVASVISSI